MLDGQQDDPSRAHKALATSTLAFTVCFAVWTIDPVTAHAFPQVASPHPGVEEEMVTLPLMQDTPAANWHRCSRSIVKGIPSSSIDGADGVPGCASNGGGPSRHPR